MPCSPFIFCLSMTGSLLPDFFIGIIFGLAYKETLQNEIAGIVSCSQSTVSCILQENDINTFQMRLLWPPKAKKTTACDERKLVRLALANWQATLSDIINLSSLNISSTTVSCRLKEHGLVKHVARRKPMLTAHHMATRLRWAIKHRN